MKNDYAPGEVKISQASPELLAELTRKLGPVDKSKAKRHGGLAFIEGINHHKIRNRSGNVIGYYDGKNFRKLDDDETV